VESATLGQHGRDLVIVVAAPTGQAQQVECGKQFLCNAGVEMPKTREVQAKLYAYHGEDNKWRTVKTLRESERKVWRAGGCATHGEDLPAAVHAVCALHVTQCSACSCSRHTSKLVTCAGGCARLSG
jgi:hypothetical protein